MAEEETFDYESYFSETNGKLTDLEEKHTLLRDRILLIGKNLVESRDNTKSEISELKRDVNELKSDIKRIKEIMETTLEDFDDFARKEELEVLARQLDMFSPLNIATLDDVEKLIKKSKS